MGRNLALWQARFFRPFPRLVRETETLRQRDALRPVRQQQSGADGGMADRRDGDAFGGRKRPYCFGLPRVRREEQLIIVACRCRSEPRVENVGTHRKQRRRQRHRLQHQRWLVLLQVLLPLL